MKRIVLHAIVVASTLGHTQALDTVWTRTLGGAAADVANSVQMNADGGYIIAGSTITEGDWYHVMQCY